jgi:threonylcarbamoyladenosine tRNA methylthiotransferase MtaB
VIVGFPSEDEAAWRRSIDFIRSIGFAGIHAFRYSVRPGTAAVRMTGSVDEPTKKARAAELLALAAEARASRARASIGAMANVLFESRIDDGRWLGHASDYVAVAASVPPATDGALSLENVIGRVAIEHVDPGAPERAIGRIVAMSPPPVASIAEGSMR